MTTFLEHALRAAKSEATVRSVDDYESPTWPSDGDIELGSADPNCSYGNSDTFYVELGGVKVN